MEEVNCIGYAVFNQHPLGVTGNQLGFTLDSAPGDPREPACERGPELRYNGKPGEAATFILPAIVDRQ